jgi:glycosyltransferase involved in cell wall biosynthesis
MIDIINAYASAGYNCILITGRLIIRNTTLHPSVKTDWIIQYNRATNLMRLFTWITGFIQILWKVLTKYKKDELFIVSNPPIALLLPILVKNQCDLLIFDIYPEALIETGYLSDNSLMVRWWKKSNRKAFHKARNIFTISNVMKRVLDKYTKNDLVQVVPMWTDNTFFKPIDPVDNPFIVNNNLLGKFVVMYSGNLGLSVDIEIMAEMAAQIKRNDIVFLIIGDGQKKELIIDKVVNLGLSNVIFLPWQPPDKLPYSLSSASIAVIFHGEKISKLAIPSKLYNFLSVGAPLLCVTPEGSEVEKLVTKYKCGYSFEAHNVKGMVNFIIEIALNKEFHRQLQSNSLQASKDFNVSNVDKFLQRAS